MQILDRYLYFIFKLNFPRSSCYIQYKIDRVLPFLVPIAYFVEFILCKTFHRNSVVYLTISSILYII
jgi:hypothetical protein